MAKTILIAEDSEDDAILLQQTLKTAGVSNPIVMVTDGDEVLAYFKGEGRFSDRIMFPLPSVLLLDLKMARIGGYEVLDWLQTHPEFQPLLIIAVTAFHELKEVQKAYLLGAKSFITKPSKPEDFHLLMQSFPEYWESLPPPGQGSSGAPMQLV